LAELDRLLQPRDCLVMLPGAEGDTPEIEGRSGIVRVPVAKGLEEVLRGRHLAGVKEVPPDGDIATGAGCGGGKTAHPPTSSRTTPLIALALRGCSRLRVGCSPPL
jgi:hypothetical protein